MLAVTPEQPPSSSSTDGSGPDAGRPERRALLREVFAGYDGKSLVALVALLTVGGAVGYRWSDLLDANAQMDWLLAGIWAWLAAMMCWRIQPRRDVFMLAVGLCGGATIEWWGTNTELWRYFTGEKPPLWILPAWPAATLAIDRMGSFLALLLERAEARAGRTVAPVVLRVAYFLLVPAFVVWMTTFLWPKAHLPASQVVLGLMVVVAAFTLDPRRDIALFAAGTVMGLFLEYWGTSRYCWTYYTREIPPPVAVVAHGFAAVAFARCGDGVERVVSLALELAGLKRAPA